MTTGIAAPEVWKAEDIAEWLGVCPRYVAEKLSKKRDFPPRLPVGRGRWLKHEVIDWADRARKQCR